MAREFISKKTRSEFREYFVKWSTLGGIQDEFEAVGIACADDYVPPVGGQRRTLVERYYRTLDFTKIDDARKALKLFENALGELDEVAQNDESRAPEASKALAGLTRWLKKDGYLYRDGVLASSGPNTVAPALKLIAERLDAPYLVRQVEVIEGAVETDPRLAIGTAKELIESVCKTILKDRGVTVERSWDVVKLVKTALKELDLTPDDIPDAAKGAETIKRLLMNLATVTQGLAEIRNLFGTGHGPEGRVRGLQPRHARLMAGAAVTLATFLFETQEVREAE